MHRIIELFGLLSVLMRGLVLSTLSLTVGGVIFYVAVLPRGPVTSDSIDRAILLWIKRWALLLAVVEILYASLDAAMLMESGGFGLREIITANFALAGILAVVSSLAIFVLAGSRYVGHKFVLLFPSVLMLGASTMTSHAITRLDNRLLLAMLTASHQAAAAAWIGGLPFLLISLKHSSDPAIRREISAKLSRLAMFSVAILVTAGFGLARSYVGSWRATYGEVYGIMVVGKVALFAILISLVALNFRIVRQPLGGADSLMRSLRHFTEVEIAVGITAVLMAASLTSLPPAVDVRQNDLSTADVVSRMMPQWPPQIIPRNEMTNGDGSGKISAVKSVLTETSNPSKAPEIIGASFQETWMDDPHHWAALIVIPVGLLALMGHSKRFRYAKNWPLLFPALGLILLLMSDSQYWPLGPESFWSSFLDPTVLPHRIIEILIAVFGIFEWKVQTQKLDSTKASFVFPSLVALSCALLLTHSHSVADSQAQVELVSEASHVSIAVLGVAGGWSRWLELRLPSDDRIQRIMSWIWPVCFLLVGLILATYQGDS